MLTLTLAEAVADLERHKLAETQRHRVERAKMAERLVRWLGLGNGTGTGSETPTSDTPANVGEGIDRQLAEWGWVDLALGYVWAGEDVHAELRAAYGALWQRAAERRRGLDRVFAGRLAAWTAAGSNPGEMLLVESLLPRVVAPLLGANKRPVLLLLLDGMSAAVAVELAEELRRQHWDEYDPLSGGGGGNGNGALASEPRRRAAVAALPTATRVSRASLFAAALCQGGQEDERKAFAGHRFWRGRPVRLFHGDALRGDAGELLTDELTEALSDTSTLVAVVMNTIDDALDHGREGADASWRIADVGPLRALLDYARSYGRAVILTSDHGHVLDQGGRLRTVPDAASARHRSGEGPAVDGAVEVELAGSRVIAPGSRIVALWDPAIRYTARKAGYHGGASLAEVTVPLLAFLPLGAAPPTGWHPLADQRPTWWSPTPARTDGEAPSAPEAGGGEAHRAAPKGQRAGPKPQAAPEASQSALFGDMTAARPQPERPAPTEAWSVLVDELLGSEMFAAQHSLTPRKVPTEKIRAAVAALLDANGVLPVTVLADRAGEQAARAVGFVTTLQRIFNVDNYPVLSVVDDGRTVRLDARLLREQFGLHQQGQRQGDAE